jgi:hypothetical protein
MAHAMRCCTGGERLYACMMTALRPHGRDFPDFVEDVPAELAVMSLSFSAAKKKVPQRKSRHCVVLEALSSSRYCTRPAECHPDRPRPHPLSLDVVSRSPLFCCGIFCVHIINYRLCQ